MDHHVRKETLQITVDTEALAFELQPRLQQLNHTTLLPIIERVFDELSLSDRSIFIERLEIDLGSVSKADLDQEIAVRFERQLREALRVAIDRVDRRPSGRERVLADEQAQLESLERYLVTGTLPFWAAATDFDLEAWIARLSASAPDGLTSLLGRRQFDAGVIERLTNQIGEASVERLFHLLDRLEGARIDRPDARSLDELYRTDREALAALLRDRRERLTVARFFQRLDRVDLAALVQQLASEIARQGAADEAMGAQPASAERSPQPRAIAVDAAADRPVAGQRPPERRPAGDGAWPPERPAQDRPSPPADDIAGAGLARTEGPGVGEQPERSIAADAVADRPVADERPIEERAAPDRPSPGERPALDRAVPLSEAIGEAAPALPEGPEQGESPARPSAADAAADRPVAGQRPPEERLAREGRPPAERPARDRTSPPSDEIAGAGLTRTEGPGVGEQPEPLSEAIGEAAPALSEGRERGESPARSIAAADRPVASERPIEDRAARERPSPGERPALDRAVPLSEAIGEPGPARTEGPEQGESPARSSAADAAADRPVGGARRIDDRAAREGTSPGERLAGDHIPPEGRPARDRVSPPLEEIDESRLRDLYRSDRPALVALLRRLFGKEPLQWPLEKLHDQAEEWIRDLYRMDRRALVPLVRDRHQRLLVERFLLRLDHKALADLVRQLSPEDSDQIAADVAALAGLPSVRRRAGPSEALRLLWLTTADIQLTTLDEPYDRRTFVKALLTAFAERAGQTIHDFLTALIEDWTFLPESDDRAVQGARPLRSIVAELAGDRSVELPPAIGAEPAREPSGAPAPMFARYDLEDAVLYYLRHGVLPFSVSLLRPGLTAAEAFDVLPDLPLQSLRAVLADLDADARVRAWRRVVRQLPTPQVARFISGLIDRSGLPAARERARLSSLATDAADVPGAYAFFIVRVIAGGPTVLAPETAAEAGAREETDQAASDADRVKAVLSSRAKGTAEAGELAPTSLRLLRSLIERDVDDTLYFLRALTHAGIAPSALVDEAPSADAVKTIQKLLPVDAATRLTRLLEPVAELPPAERPAAELLYSIVVSEILEQVDASRPEHAFFETVLDRLIRAARPLPRRDDPAAVSSSPQPAANALIETWRSDLERARDRETAESAAPPRAEVEPGDWLLRLALAPEGAGRRPLSAEASRHALLRAIDESPEVVHGATVDRVGNRAIRERWSHSLSEPELVRLTYVLEPRIHRALMDAAELLFSAWLRAARADSSPGRRARFWLFVLGFLAETRTVERSVDRLIEDFFDVFGDAGREAGTLEQRAQLDHDGGEQAPGPAWIETLMEAVIERASTTGNAAVRAIVERDRAALTAPFPRQRAAEPGSPADAAKGPRAAKSRAAPGPAPIRTAFGMVEDQAATGEPLYIANAGLVLANPFLPRWFHALDMLEDVETGKTRLRPDRLSRAVHLLQWLVDGSAATPEPLLCLNKLLCGAAPAIPVERRIEPTEDEMETCQRLLKSMLANWTIVSGTSIAGLRETFLQREGRLERTSDGWRLFVQRKTVDVLLDQIPWSISTVFHPWMLEPISVTW